jgi:RNA polymerase sigma factor (sigma-70 family)
MLEGVAQKQLSSKLQRRVGSDDVVQSACRTFCRRVSAGQFELPDADAMWRLMCAITLTKARRAARDHTRQKRGIDHEQYIDASAADGSSRAFQLAGGEQTPLDAAAFSDQMQTLLASLEPNECQVLDLKLQQNTNEEIAEIMGCSERTVRRITNQIRERWTKLFDAEAT